MSKRTTRLRVWVEENRLRWYAADGSRESAPISDFDTLNERQIETLRQTWELTLNHGRVNPLTATLVTANMTATHLWWHYLQNEASNLRDGGIAYKSSWKLYLEPRWGQTLIGEVHTIDVEQWLRDLRLLNGDLMTKEYKQKIRTCLSALFTHAQRHRLCDGNPVSCGGSDIGKGGRRGSGAGARILGDHAPKRTVIHFDPAKVLAILGRLGQRDCCLVLLDSVLGLRRGELAIRWKDCDFDNSKFLIRRSWNWRTSKEGAPKTENSVKELPMNPVLRDALLEWRKRTPFDQPDDFVFPSVRLKGKKPLALMEVFKKSIKPVIRELGFAPAAAAYGWHAFRHGVGTTLWDLTKDKLTVRDLLRHGTTSMTEKYIHGIDPRLEEAQDKLVNAIMNAHPQPPRTPKPKVVAMPRR
jgi:integrase